MKKEIIHFFCDESFITLENKKHIIIGIIAVKNIQKLLTSFIDLKNNLDINVFEEIKWNSAKFSEEMRTKITDKFLNIECFWEGILIMAETNQMCIKIFTKMMQQIEFYTKELNINCYTLTVDQDFINDKSFFLTWARNNQNKCIQFDIADSQLNQLIQFTDLFTGFHNRLVFNFHRDNDRIIKLSENCGYGMPVETEISWMIKMAFRYKLWGQSIGYKENGMGPYKNSFGKGFNILHSSISEKLTEIIKMYFSEIYMGCIH